MNDKYQDFLSKLQDASESERDWLVMEFSLQNLSETLRQTVWAAAIPHWFDREFLNAVLANPLKDSDFKTLTELSFIEVYPERGFNVHERSRNLLLDKLWANNKARYQKLSKRAAAYCKKQDQNVAAWRVETLYHGLLANNPSAKGSFIQQGFDWLNSFQYDNLEILTQVVLEAVNSGKLTGEVAAWAAYWQALLDVYYSRYLSAQNFLHQALQQKTNNFLTAHCFTSLGDAHYHLFEFEQAQDCYKKASIIYNQIEKHPVNEANCISSFGNMHFHLAEYKQALDFYQKALLIYQKNKMPVGEANCILFIGDVHRHLAQYKQAQDFYQQALPIYQKIKAHIGEANCIRSSGLLHGAQQQTELAVTTLQQAAELYEEIRDKRSKAGCFNELAILYQRQKQFEPALAAFEQAIEIFPHVIWYQNRAALYMQMDDYEKAEADIKQADTIGKNSTYTLLIKAELALWRQQAPQAIELCQQALTQRPADGCFRAFFALTLLANGQAQAACTEMERALTTIYQKHDFNDLLDYLNKLAKIYGHTVEVDTLRGQILNHPVMVSAEQNYKPVL